MPVHIQDREFPFLHQISITHSGEKQKTYQNKNKPQLGMTGVFQST